MSPVALAQMAGALLRKPLRLLNWRHGADAAKRRPGLLVLADRLGREPGRIRFLDNLAPPPPAPAMPDLERFGRAEAAAAWLGHATLLLRVGGKTILTDPVFSPRVGVGLVFATIGPKRRQQPALSIAQLPKIDLILSSHAHFDHLDRPSLWQLARRFGRVPVVAAEGTSDLLHDLGFGEIQELKWEGALRLGDLSLSAIPVKHWGPRVFYDDWRGYNAYLLEATKRRSEGSTKRPEGDVPPSAASTRILFGGDTAYTETFAGLGPLDLFAVGISAYDPFVAAHATPEQAWAMAQLAGAQRLAAMHHTTFRLSREPMDEPLRRLLNAAGAEADRIVIRNVGDLWTAQK